MIGRNAIRSGAAALLISAGVVAGAPPANPFHADMALLPTIDADLRARIAAAPLRLQFQGATPAELQQWQQRFAEKLRDAIGPHDPPARWTVRVLSTRTFPDHVREELLLAAEGVPSLPLYVLRPAGPRSDRRPIMICLHGHGFGYDTTVGRADTPALAAQIEKYNYAYGLALVREGYLVVAPCMIPFGRRLDAPTRAQKTDPCAIAYIRLQMLGRTVVGENLRDIRWALDYASAREDVQPDRVGVAGLSYGGRMAMIAAALEPRIRVAVLSCVLNVWQERVQRHDYACGAQTIPGILEWGDTPEIGALIAPRTALWEYGIRDKAFVPAWAEQAVARLRRAYAAAGHPEALQFHSFDGGHEWNGSRAIPLLARELKDD